jgi:ribose 1,5-bisphosphokinase PhnN
MVNSRESVRDPRKGAFRNLLVVIRRVLGQMTSRQVHQPSNAVILPQHLFVQKLFVIVGTPGSGKDLLIRAVGRLGTQHAQIVPKHSSRARRWWDDGDEIICREDPGYDLGNCDIQYENYGDRYGIKSSQIWEGLSDGIFQVVVVSNVEAINKLRDTFGELVALVYVHSEVDADEYRRIEAERKSDPEYLDAEYVEQRVKNYRLAFDIFLENYLAFNHVLINSSPAENLYDQMFRLFRAYERGVLSSATESPVPERIWTDLTAPSRPRRIMGGEVQGQEVDQGPSGT